MRILGGRTWNYVTCKYVILCFILVVLISSLFRNGRNALRIQTAIMAYDKGTSQDTYLEVPQMVWGLNNQKIAFARACLTARMLNRTLIMPELSASLFYKESSRSESISFDKVFDYEKFNARCHGFVQLGYFSSIRSRVKRFSVQKGSGRRWTAEKDMNQLKELNRYPFAQYKFLHIRGKNPFLWHDHWPVKDYARVFDCLILTDKLLLQTEEILSRIRSQVQNERDEASVEPHYMAVHMRIEIDWMIHCRNLERRRNVTQICCRKDEIINRTGNIIGLRKPVLVYLAIADDLVHDTSLFTGWEEGLVPVDKKKLGVDGVFRRYPYLIQSAIDYELCLRSDVFVGNSFSTFSSLVVLERTQRMLKITGNVSCDAESPLPSFAYNVIKAGTNAPSFWRANMSDSNLHAISYGTNAISC